MIELAILGLGLVVGLAAGVWLTRDSSEPEPDLAPPLPSNDDDPRVRTALGHYRLLRTLSVLPVGILVIDNDGDISFRNDMAAEFEDENHTDALVRRAVDEIVAAANEGIRSKRELMLYGPPKRYLVFRGAPVHDEDTIVGTVVSIEDTSELHRVDEIRRDFVANVSHELKTPVGAIGVLAEMLVGSQDPVVVDRLSGRLHEEAIRLGATIDDLLTLSQIEAGDIEALAATSMSSVIDQAFGRVQALAELRNITVDLDVDADLSVVVYERQLVSAVANLIDNALKYSEDGSKVEVQVIRQGAWATIDVADYGVGIPQSDLDRIFERFYRVDPARSRSTGGTGLGLSIVRNVAAAVGGTVEVRSTEGQGSVFTLRIPREPDQSPTGPRTGQAEQKSDDAKPSPASPASSSHVVN